MRVKTTMKWVEVPECTYIAEDGKEFESELECRHYEDECLYEKRKSKFIAMERKKNLRIPYLDLATDSTTYVLHCDNRDDYEFAEEYLKFGSFAESYMDDADHHEYPCDIVVVSTDSWYEDIGTYEQVLTTFKEMVKEMED